MARFGLLTFHNGNWNGKQLISEQWIKQSTTPTKVQPTYGYMNFFLNTDKKYLPSAPASAFVHVGNGTNIIYVDKENDLVMVIRWIENRNIDEMVKKSIKEGAELATGGQRLGKENGGSNKGFFYKPTILKNVTPRMEVAREETFGPVAPVIVAEDEQQALEIANDTKFGLGASVWTQNLNKAEKYSKLLQAGIVTVNNVVVSDPRVPFGGIKNSGFGRELSKHGMFEFVNIKSIRFYDQLIHQHYVE